MGASSCRDLCLTALLLGLAAGVIAFLVIDSNKKPRYSVAIDAVSGLDLDGPTLDPRFDLTVRLVARELVNNNGGKECFVPGSAVVVSYRGQTLASGPVPLAPPLCAQAMHRRAAEQRMSAWGAGVRLPGYLLDSLAADVRRGVEAFDVTITIPSAHDNGHEGRVAVCAGRRPGGGDAALLTPCTLSQIDYMIPYMPQQPTTTMLLPPPANQQPAAAAPAGAK